MELFPLLILVATAILVVILIIIIFPVISAQIRAKKQGVNLSIREAHALSNIPNLPDQFLNTAADLRKLDRNAYIGSLVDFHVAGGNLSNLKDGLEKIKSSGKDVSFNTLLLLNLAKKDVQEALDNIDKVYNVEVRDIEENNLSINYSCEFKVNFKDSFWVNPDMEQIKENVKTKISLALLSTNSNDENLEDFIKNKYLHRTFWREQANAIVLNHNIEITN
jgi:hypothetical protein